MQIGDGTNYVIIFGAALLEGALGLLNLGITPLEIAVGYEKALEFVESLLPQMISFQLEDVCDVEVFLKLVTDFQLAINQFGSDKAS